MHLVYWIPMHAPRTSFANSQSYEIRVPGRILLFRSMMTHLLVKLCVILLWMAPDPDYKCFKMAQSFILKYKCKCLHVSGPLWSYGEQKWCANGQTLIFHSEIENHFPASQEGHLIQCVAARHSPSLLCSLSLRCHCSSSFLPLSEISPHNPHPHHFHHQYNITADLRSADRLRTLLLPPSMQADYDLWQEIKTRTICRSSTLHYRHLPLTLVNSLLCL